MNRAAISATAWLVFWGWSWGCDRVYKPCQCNSWGWLHSGGWLIVSRFLLLQKDCHPVTTNHIPMVWKLHQRTALFCQLSVFDHKVWWSRGKEPGPYCSMLVISLVTFGTTSPDHICHHELNIAAEISLATSSQGRCTSRCWRSKLWIWLVKSRTVHAEPELVTVSTGFITRTQSLLSIFHVEIRSMVVDSFPR